MVGIIHMKQHFTDVSDLHSAGIITQIPVSDLSLCFEEQRH